MERGWWNGAEGTSHVGSSPPSQSFYRRRNLELGVPFSVEIFHEPQERSSVNSSSLCGTILLTRRRRLSLRMSELARSPLLTLLHMEQQQPSELTAFMMDLFLR